MQYVKAAIFPAAVAIVCFVAWATLELLALRQYFSGGFAEGLGQLVWDTRIPNYAVTALIGTVAIWAGYRATNVGRAWIAAISSGALLTTLFVAFWSLIFFLTRGLSGLGALFDGPHTGFWRLSVITIIAGAVGAWWNSRNESAT